MKRKKYLTRDISRVRYVKISHKNKKGKRQKKKAQRQVLQKRKKKKKKKKKKKMELNSSEENLFSGYDMDIHLKKMTRPFSR